jgi:hypothetical protein
VCEKGDGREIKIGIKKNALISIVMNSSFIADDKTFKTVFSERYEPDKNTRK